MFAGLSCPGGCCISATKQQRSQGGLQAQGCICPMTLPGHDVYFLHPNHAALGLQELALAVDVVLNPADNHVFRGRPDR